MAEEPRVKERIRFNENGERVSRVRFGSIMTEEKYNNGRKMDTEHFQDYYFIPTGYMVEIL